MLGEGRKGHDQVKTPPPVDAEGASLHASLSLGPRPVPLDGRRDVLHRHKDGPAGQREGRELISGASDAPQRAKERDPEVGPVAEGGIRGAVRPTLNVVSKDHVGAIWGWDSEEVLASRAKPGYCWLSSHAREERMGDSLWNAYGAAMGVVARRAGIRAWVLVRRGGATDVVKEGFAAQGPMENPPTGDPEGPVDSRVQQAVPDCGKAGAHDGAGRAATERVVASLCSGLRARARGGGARQV